MEQVEEFGAKSSSNDDAGRVLGHQWIGPMAGGQLAQSTLAGSPTDWSNALGQLVQSTLWSPAD